MVKQVRNTSNVMTVLKGWLGDPGWEAPNPATKEAFDKSGVRTSLNPDGRALINCLHDTYGLPYAAQTIGWLYLTDPTIFPSEWTTPKGASSLLRMALKSDIAEYLKKEEAAESQQTGMAPIFEATIQELTGVLSKLQERETPRLVEGNHGKEKK
jgi:DNA-binding MarR family transcriptional regulator